MEAGCKKKVWETREGIPLRYHLNSTGKLLATGVCILDDYQKHFPPEDGTTKVYSTLETHEVRDVDAKKKTLSIDFTLTMRWLDSRIKTSFAHDNNTSEEVLLGPAAIDKIWSPDLHIWNRQSFKAKEEWATLITTRVLENQDINILDGKNMTRYDLSIPTIEMKYEVKTTVYCMDWKYINYPMDDQECNVMFGSASASSIFTLLKKCGDRCSRTTYSAVNFNITIKFFDGSLTDGMNHVGIKILMKRLTTSFVYKYYAPCIAIVLVSEIGFIIPATAIPGRVALLVTQFLTLVNLFIHQMVSNLHKHHSMGVLLCKHFKDMF